MKYFESNKGAPLFEPFRAPNVIHAPLPNRSIPKTDKTPIPRHHQHIQLSARVLFPCMAETLPRSQIAHKKVTPGHLSIAKTRPRSQIGYENLTPSQNTLDKTIPRSTHHGGSQYTTGEFVTGSHFFMGGHFLILHRHHYQTLTLGCGKEHNLSYS